MWIVYGVMRYYSRAQGGLLFGARVEPGWTEEPEVRAIRKTFVRQMNRYALLLLVLQLGLLLIPYVSIAMTVWVIWMIAAIVVLEIPYVRANHALRRWKAERGYVRSGEQRRLVELKGLGQLRCVRCPRLAGEGDPGEMAPRRDAGHLPARGSDLRRCRRLDG